MKTTSSLRKASAVLLPIALITLTGCWTPPNAKVQPEGSPGLIQQGIMVESARNPATVKAIDLSSRTITLQFPDGTSATCEAGPGVKNFGKIQAGDKVKATMTKDLAIYILDNGRLPDGPTAESLGINAKVLKVDPSYRLLTLQYPDGRRETVKPGLGTKMEQMAPGDSVVVRPVEITAIKIVK
jgi:hypothetical protein